MSFYVYGRDAVTGEVLRRFLSETISEADARADGENRGMVVTGVVRCPPPQAPSTAAPIHVTYTAQEESAEFERQLEVSTPRVWVTYFIIGINIVVFALMVWLDGGELTPSIDNLQRWGADFGPLTTHGEWWRLLSNQFVHTGVIHLAANMVAFGYVGRTVERMLGNVGFLLTYLVAGLGASIASLVWNPLLVSAGASGAVFGIYGALLGMLLRGRGAMPAQVFEQLKWFAIVFVVYNMLGGLGNSGIDNAAHVGGALCGFLCGVALGQPLNAGVVAARSHKNLLTGAVSAVVLLVAVAWLRNEYLNLDQISSSFEQIIALDEKDSAALKQATARVKSGDLAQNDLSALIEKDLLPEWRSAKARLDGLAPYPFSVKSRVERVARYMQKRQAQWEKEIGER